MTTEQRVLAETRFLLSRLNQIDVTPSSNLFDDLNLNSIDVVDLLLNIDEEFGISLSDEVSESWQTVADVINSVEEALKKL